MIIRRCVLCGSVIDDQDDEEFREGYDDPELCGMCQEVADD